MDFFSQPYPQLDPKKTAEAVTAYAATHECSADAALRRIVERYEALLTEDHGFSDAEFAFICDVVIPTGGETRVLQVGKSAGYSVRRDVLYALLGDSGDDWRAPAFGLTHSDVGAFVDRLQRMSVAEEIVLTEAVEHYWRPGQ